MYAGKIVEMQSVRGLFYAPRHPYTKALLDSIPKLGTKEPLYAVPGQPPDLSALPSGCSFHPRCRHTMARCRLEEPPEQCSDGSTTRCWLTATAEPVPEAVHG
jgi:oligopeptide/dipeptide ABC transporter ATP-binding protein